ncbi:PREDICTED: uncharacterized protein LOC108776136 [Cyphomyrmex costatus]|uniref:uncharacterized protein LOC108776136 n=1 Tax=Cyphomyrmex costatus TaxID=456900 RepID=UPI0008522BC6|nr:PREDICTED: uncharacterized protein LOC108776136 [Cyphomyrmex costatus]XP_018398164.1 PREDICTED: uncharacterized protein LOC108776136 [Cyphomyrmex costatus]
MPFHCIVPGCKTGYKDVIDKNTRKKLSLFKPRTDDMLLKWQQIIQRPKSKPLLKSNRVCELHFREEDIKKHYVTELSDGNTFTMLKGKPSLKLGAVPSKLLNGDAENKSQPSRSIQQHNNFKIQDPTTELTTENNSRSNLANSEAQSSPIQKYTSSIQECTSPIQECASSIQKCASTTQKCTSPIQESTSPIQECASPIQECASPIQKKCALSIKKYTLVPVDKFTMAQIQYKKVILPTKLWFSQVFSDKIIWAQWGDQYNTARRVTLLRDMNLQMFIEDRQIHIPGLKKIKRITDMSAVLRQVSTLLPCNGVGMGTEGKTIKCSGYILEKNNGSKARRCEICKKRRMQVMRQLRNIDTNTWKVKCTKKSKELKNAIRRNFTLQAKIKRLQLKIRSLQQSVLRQKNPKL